MSLEGRIPRINWPQKTNDYKVVQVDIGGKRYLRFQEKGHRFAGEKHSEILTSFAEMLGKECPIGKLVDYHDKPLPDLESDWYKVHGMGLAIVNLERKTANFRGNSADYGIELDKDYLISMKQHAPEWKFMHDGEEL